ncbi:hypothetical protein NKG94_27610 [Micromonospora sp. M12]
MAALCGLPGKAQKDTARKFRLQLNFSGAELAPGFARRPVQPEASPTPPAATWSTPLPVRMAGASAVSGGTRTAPTPPSTSRRSAPTVSVATGTLCGICGVAAADREQQQSGIRALTDKVRDMRRSDLILSIGLALLAATFLVLGRWDLAVGVAVGAALGWVLLDPVRITWAVFVVAFTIPVTIDFGYPTNPSYTLLLLLFVLAAWGGCSVRSATAGPGTCSWQCWSSRSAGCSPAWSIGTGPSPSSSVSHLSSVLACCPGTSSKRLGTIGGWFSGSPSGSPGSACQSPCSPNTRRSP